MCPHLSGKIRRSGGGERPAATTAAAACRAPGAQITRSVFTRLNSFYANYRAHSFARSFSSRRASPRHISPACAALPSLPLSSLSLSLFSLLLSPPTRDEHSKRPYCCLSDTRIYAIAIYVTQINRYYFFLFILFFYILRGTRKTGLDVNFTFSEIETYARTRIKKRYYDITI